MDGLIFSHDVINRFKDPGISSQIIDSFFTIHINDSVLYGFNKTGLYSAIINYADGNSINESELNSYYQNLINERIDYVKNDHKDSIKLNFFFYNELLLNI